MSLQGEVLEGEEAALLEGAVVEGNDMLIPTRHQVHSRDLEQEGSSHEIKTATDEMT